LPANTGAEVGWPLGDPPACACAGAVNIARPPNYPLRPTMRGSR
jgi:hypothetical protein